MSTRPVNKPRVATVGARPDSFSKHIGPQVRKMYQSSVEAAGRALYIDVRTDPHTGHQEWHVWASSQWRGAVCGSQELWSILGGLSRADDEGDVAGNEPYPMDVMPGKGTKRDITARTDDKQLPRDWPVVDSYYFSTTTNTAAASKRSSSSSSTSIPHAKRRVAEAPKSLTDSWVLDRHTGTIDECDPFAVLLGNAALPY